MSKYNSIQRELVTYASNSVTVEVDRVFSWVKIQSKHDDESYYFLQGGEADKFIAETDKNNDNFPDESFIDNDLLAAYVYVDCME